MKVGVMAIRSASPTLDTQVVKDKFAEVEARMMEQWVNSRRKRPTILSVTVIAIIIYN